MPFAVKPSETNPDILLLLTFDEFNGELINEDVYPISREQAQDLAAQLITASGPQPRYIVVLINGEPWVRDTDQQNVDVSFRGLGVQVARNAANDLNRYNARPDFTAEAVEV